VFQALRGVGDLWVGGALLATLGVGCAQVGPGVPSAALAQRILPPADIAGALSATPAQGSPPVPADGVMLKPPRKLPNEAMPAEKEAGPDLHVVDRVSAGPLTLDHAVALAFQLQPRLRIFWAEIDQARGREQVAFAPFLPRVDFRTQGFLSNNPTRPLNAVPPPDPEFGDARGFMDFALGEVLMQWTLWDFGRTFGRHQQAELGIDITQLQATRASQTVAFDVAAAYYGVLETQATGRVARESVRRAESILDVARKSLKAGLVERDQVLRAEVQLASTQRAVVNAERGERVAVAALNLAIGLNVSAPTEIVDRTDEPPFDMSLAECLQRAVENRREFQVSRRLIESAQEGVRAVRADFAPRVFVQGMVAGEDGEKTLRGSSQSASINIAWSLFQGGRRLGELRAADADVRAAAAQAQVVCDTISFEVNEAYRDVEAARRNIVLAQPAVTQARENLRLVTRKYEAGDATSTDIVDAENSLTRAQQDYYTARYDYLTALARIDYAIGVAPFVQPGGTTSTWPGGRPCQPRYEPAQHL